MFLAMLELAAMNPLVFHSMIILSSLIILGKSADFIVYGISEYAKKIGMSGYLIGLLVISLGTALPELVSAITGTLIGQGEIVFGVVMGSNLFKIPLLGLVLLLLRKIPNIIGPEEKVPGIIILIALMPFALAFDGVVSRTDGMILLAFYIFYIARLWRKESSHGKMLKDIQLKAIWRDGLIFTFSLVATLLSARWLVFSSVRAAALADISPYVIGLIIIGIGSSTPEIFVQIRSAMQKKNDIALGNVIGSFTANSGFVLGIAALIKPFTIDFSILWATLVFFAIGLLVIMALMRRPNMTWKHGLFLLALYGVFLFFELLFS